MFIHISAAAKPQGANRCAGMIVRLTFFFVFAILTALVSHIFFGSIIFAAAQQEASAIVLKDAYKRGTHELSGIVMVPSSCHDLTVRTKDVTQTMSAIIFETWEQPFLTGCDRSPNPRSVQAIIFGSEHLDIRAIYDGEWAPLTLVPAL